MKRPFFLLLVWSPACLIACGEDSSTGPTTPTDTAILGGYAISLPSDYENRSGIGIDTYFFLVERNDGKVVFQVELGPGTPYERTHFVNLPATHLYPNRISFESNGQAGAYYYEAHPDWQLRQIEGIVVFDAASAEGFEEIFFTSHSEDSLPEVLEILHTLHH